MLRTLTDDALPRDRLLTLYQRLTLDGRPHFQSDLARELGCSPQTVARLVDVVERHLGKDAEVERELDGRRRTYRIRSKAEEKGLGFSFEELRYLATCRDLAAPLLPEGVAQRIDRTLTMLALQLGEANGQSVTGLSIGFRSKGYIDFTPYLPTIATLRQAIAKRQVCYVTYTASGRDSARTYRYAPGRILAMNGTLYVQGYQLPEGSLLKERSTNFLLHRIGAVSPTGEFFSFNAADADARAFGLNWHEPKRVKVHIARQAADYVRDRVWSQDQTIEEQDDGSLILSVTTTSEKELKAWVWSFGDAAEVIETDGVPETLDPFAAGHGGLKK